MAELDDDVGEGQEEEKSFFERMVDSHSGFTNAIKSAHPLAVMASLSIAIAAFTKTSFPSVQPYAISASFLFLLAYVCSLAVGAFPSFVLVICSYLFTAMGIASLFLVIIEFSQTNPPLVNILLSIPMFFVGTFSIASVYMLYKRIRQYAFGIKDVILLIALSTSAAMILLMIGNVFYVMFVLGLPLTESALDFLLYVLAGFFCLLIASGLVVRAAKRRQGA